MIYRGTDHNHDNVKIRSAKCSFLKRGVRYLGFGMAVAYGLNRIRATL